VCFRVGVRLRRRRRHPELPGQVAALLALAGAVVFTFIFPPVGGLIAAPLILFFVENRRQGDSNRAMKTVKAMMVGWGWGFVIRFVLGMVMIGLWGAWALSN
jgi:uncharacterized protein YqgC (DUF456 family)